MQKFICGLKQQAIIDYKLTGSGGNQYGFLSLLFEMSGENDRRNISQYDRGVCSPDRCDEITVNSQKFFCLDFEKISEDWAFFKWKPSTFDKHLKILARLGLAERIRVVIDDGNNSVICFKFTDLFFEKFI